MWPFSWFGSSEPDTPDYVTKNVEETITGTLTFKTVEVRWASDREDERITGEIATDTEGIHFQSVEPCVMSSGVMFSQPYLAFNRETERFVPYANIEDWEVVDTEERRFSKEATVKRTERFKDE